MNWYSFLPTNKYVWLGFILMMLGFFTLPILIGLAIMPIGILILVLGLHKAYYDAGKKLWEKYKKIRENLGKK